MIFGKNYIIHNIKKNIIFILLKYIFVNTLKPKIDILQNIILYNFHENQFNCN